MSDGPHQASRSGSHTVMGVLSSFADMQDFEMASTWQQGYDYERAATMATNRTAAKADVYTTLVEQEENVSSDIRDDVLEATQEASQLMSRRLRQAQLAALRGAEAQIAAKKRVDGVMPAREKASSVLVTSVEDYPTGWHRKDPRLDVREPPSPAAASTASHGAFSTGSRAETICMSTESRAAFESSQCSEAESVHSQRSSASQSMTNSEASRMKAKIYAAMEKLAQAREAAASRRNRGVQASSSSVQMKAHEETTVPLPSNEPKVGSTELPVEVSVAQPPREGAAWEAARLEVARALAEGTPEVGESRLPAVSETRDAATLRPHQAGSLGLKRHKVREKERFAAAVALQMRAQEAMKKRVEMSEMSRKQDPIMDSS